MMVLYSGMTCPFSHSCRFVLFEKGCEFEIQDIDMFQPIDVSSLNPYGEVPILRERELTLYQAEVINMYIDDRFPHPQLMPPDPMHAPAPVSSSTFSTARYSPRSAFLRTVL